MVTSEFSESDRFYDCTVASPGSTDAIGANACQLFVTSAYFREIMASNPGLRNFELPVNVSEATLKKVMAFLNHGRDEFDASDEEIRDLVRINHVLRADSLVYVVEELFNRQMAKIWEETNDNDDNDVEDAVDNINVNPLGLTESAESDLNGNSTHASGQKKVRRVSDESSGSSGSKIQALSNFSAAIFSLRSRQRGWVHKLNAKILGRRIEDQEIFAL